MDKVTSPLVRSALAAAIFVNALTLPGCTGFVTPNTPANVQTDLTQLQADANTWVAAFQGILPELAASLGPKYAGTIARLNADLTKAQGYAAQISGFTNVGNATSTAQELTTVMSDMLKLAASLPIPAPYNTAVIAAQVLLPLIISEAGLPQAAAAPLYTGAANVPSLSGTDARRRLKLAATTGK